MVPTTKRHRRLNLSEARPSIDVRELPIYSVTEAAFYIGIPVSTLRAWTRGRRYKVGKKVHWFRPLIQPADPATGRLSFANVAEAHVLQATRERSVPLSGVRDSLEYLRQQVDSAHPLITQEFFTHQKELFIKQLRIVNVSRFGQLALDFLDPYLDRLVRDKSGLPFRLFPMRANPERRVMLDLNIASGQPVLTGTGILAEVLYGRFKAGESTIELAADYGVDERTIEDAVRYVEAA